MTKVSVNRRILATSHDGKFSFTLTLMFCICIKWIQFFLDSKPRLYLGDSASYLTEWVPTDRSWIYGALIRPIMTSTESLTSILMMQGTVNSIVISLAAKLVFDITGSIRLSVLFLILALVEPFSVFYERAILTDGLASVLFVLLLTVISFAFRQPNPAHRLVMVSGLVSMIVVASILLLRVAYLPVCLGLSLYLLIVALVFNWRASGVSRDLAVNKTLALAVATGIALGPLLAVSVNATLQPERLGWHLNKATTRFLVGVYAPAIGFDMLETAGLEFDEESFNSLQMDNLKHRNGQIFSPTGFYKLLRVKNSGLSDAEFDKRLSGLLGIAVRNNPKEIAKILLHQFKLSIDPRKHIGYLESGGYIKNIQNFSGHYEGFAEKSINPHIWQDINVDFPRESSLAEAYLARSGIYSWFIYFFSLIAPLLVIFIRKPVRPVYGFLAIAGFGYALSTLLFSIDLVLRFMVPLSVIALINLSLTFDSVFDKLQSNSKA